MKQKTKDAAIIKDYPPPNHMLRDLSFVLAFQGPDKATVRAPVGAAVSTDSGTMQLGVAATLADVLGGGLALRTFYPYWAATTHLSVHSTGQAVSGYIDAQGELRKTGRNSVLVKVDITQTSHGERTVNSVATAVIN
jgi:acyl-coenzyme A thioesterase PaaI-like protein